MGANVHLPGQDAPQWGHVGGGGRGALRGPAGERRGAGEVAEAAATLGQRGGLAAGGSGQCGTGSGILHWHESLREGRRREKETSTESLTGLYTQGYHGDRLSTQSAALLRYYKDKKPTSQASFFFF